MHIERFAPSPTGPLHLGHAYSAWTGWRAAKDAGGRFLLRLEDLDQARVKPDYAQAIAEDLLWLGLTWHGSIMAQSARQEAYRTVLSDLSARRLTYRCTCSRRDINDALSAPQEGVQIGPDGPVYPGTCRGRDRPSDGPHAIRLNMGAALHTIPPERLTFREVGSGPEGETGTITLTRDQIYEGAGDIVLCRRDGAVAYHLAVVIDDAHQGVTHVTRGQDLFEATQVHIVLQALLDLPRPVYRHHALVRDQAGKRLAKRDDARAISVYRAEGMTPEAVIARACAMAR